MFKSGISIIVCCFNSEDRLTELLPHLEKLDRRGLSLEIIVVNNLSTDSTYKLAETFFQSSKITGKVIDEDTPGLSFARKTGVFEARYSIVLFCDDDNFFELNYLLHGFELFRKHSMMGCLGGMGYPEMEFQFPEWFETFAASYAVGSLGKVSGVQLRGTIHYGAGLFFRTEALIAYYSRNIDSPITDRKGKSLSSGGDSELCLAIQLEGFEMWYDSGLRFLHKIDAVRVSTDYYIKLRKGIIANYPILSAYEFLLKDEVGDYRIYLIRKAAGLILGSLKTGFKFLIHRDFRSKVFFFNYFFKLNGFFRNYSSAIKLFNSLKSTYFS